MEFLNYLIIIYLIIINIISVIITVLDKYRAIKHQYRISEKALLTLSIIGGSVGMYFTMQLIRHKTRHLKFMLGIPLIIILQIILVITVYIYAGQIRI